MYYKPHVLLVTAVFFTFNNYAELSYNLVQGLPNISITAKSEQIGHTWLNGTVWEKHLIEKFYALLHKNRFFVVIDFGAQTGCFTLLSKFFPNSHWYAFEPIQEAVEALQENLKLNCITHVTVIPKAGAEYSGKATLNMPAMHAWGLSTIGEHVQRFDTVMRREIDCISLDNYVAEQNIQKIDFIKLDTEGSELLILRGGKKTIQRDRPIILMEYNETNMAQCGISKSQVDSFLNNMGYKWQLVSTEDILCFPI